MLQDLIISAVNEVMRTVEDTTNEEMEKTPGRTAAVCRDCFKQMAGEYNPLPFDKTDRASSLPFRELASKTAQRLAFYMLTLSKEQTDALRERGGRSA